MNACGMLLLPRSQIGGRGSNLLSDMGMRSKIRHAYYPWDSQVVAVRARQALPIKRSDVCDRSLFERVHKNLGPHLWWSGRSSNSPKHRKVRVGEFGSLQVILSQNDRTTRTVLTRSWGARIEESNRRHKSRSSPLQYRMLRLALCAV
jgi:hypothetical protein